MATTLATPTARVGRRRPPREALNGAARFRPQWVPWLWVALPLFIVIAFSVWPFVQTVYLSLTDADPLSRQGQYVALENYAYLLGDARWWNAVLNSVVYALGVVPLMVLLPLLLALLVRDNIPFIGLFRSLYYIPAIASLVVVSLAWTAILRDNGVLNNFLVGLGVLDSPVSFLTGRRTLLICAMAITLWAGIPYYMIMYLSALANVDRSLYEAAAVDGAGAVRTFFTVTIPGVRVMMMLVGTLAFIGCMKIFTEPHLLSNGTGGIGGRSQTIAMYIRSEGLDPTYGSLGIGSAASVLLFVMTIGFILTQRRLSAKAEEEA